MECGTVKNRTMKKKSFFSPLNSGIFENYTFKEWFMKMPRFGLMMILIAFIVLVQIKAYQGEFDEVSGYYIATGSTVLFFIVFITGTINHWKRLKEIKKRTEKNEK